MPPGKNIKEFPRDGRQPTLCYPNTPTDPRIVNHLLMDRTY